MPFVVDHFPWTGRFETAEQVGAYLAGDAIKCLLCGSGAQGMAAHLRNKHRLRVDDYRAQFGIPAGTPLLTRASAARRAASTRSVDLKAIDAWMDSRSGLAKPLEAPDAAVGFDERLGAMRGKARRS